MSLENFESIEDFLSFNMDNKRESMSWDLQIVEPFFEQLKQEKEQKEAQRLLAVTKPINLIPMPQRTRLPTSSSSTSSEVNSSEDEANDVQVLSKTTIFQDSLKENSQPHPMTRNLKHLNPEKEISVVQPPSEEKQLKSILTQKTSTDHTQKSQLKLENKIVVDKDSVTKEEISKKSDSVSNAAVPKLKRSLSSQFSNNDRRRYFDRLKELRDRRHSQITLGSDAKSIQTGKVREMIEQHHEQMLSTQSRTSPPTSHKRRSFDVEAYKRRKDFSAHVQNRRTSPLLAKKNDEEDNYEQPAVVLRKPRDAEKASGQLSPDNSNNLGTNRYQPGSKKQNYRSMDLESTDHNRFSSMTTASLPLHFTSSSSGSSECGNDEQLSCSSPSTIPPHKTVLQSQMVLWRSYSESTGSSTRRSKNLVLQASPEANNQAPNDEEAGKKFFLRDIGKIELEKNEKTDKMSEEVDSVWNDLEFGLQSFQNEVNSFSPPSSFIPKRERSLSTSETLIKRFEVTASSNNATDILKKNITLSSALSKTSDNCQALSNVPQKGNSDVIQKKKANVEPENLRQGRRRERKNASGSDGSKMSVMKLAQKYNELSASSNISVSRPTCRRSQSAGTRKHLSDLR